PPSLIPASGDFTPAFWTQSENPTVSNRPGLHNRICSYYSEEPGKCQSLRRAMASAPCRNGSVAPMFRPREATPMSSTLTAMPSELLLTSKQIAASRHLTAPELSVERRWKSGHSHQADQGYMVTHLNASQASLRNIALSGMPQQRLGSI